jgi:O-antigen/teichoic acid export membrane protein
MPRFSGLELKSVSVNTLVQFLLRIITSIPTLIATLLIAYFAGYETLGSFTKIVAFVSIFYLIVDFGMNSLFLKTYFKNINKHFGNLILLRLLFSFALVPLIALLAFLLPENRIAGTGFSDFEKYGIIIFSLTIITTGINISLQAFLQRKLSYYLSLVPALLSSLTLLGFVFFASFHHNLYLLLFSYIASGAVLTFSLFIIIKKKYKLSITKTAGFSKFSKALVIASFPLGLMLFFNLLYAKADTFILSIFRPTYDVGVYGISYKFFEVFLALPTYMANSVYPILLKESNSKGYSHLLKRYSGLFVLLSLIVTIVAFLGAPLITIFKSEFIKSVIPLQILILSLPFFFLTSLLQWHFLIKGKLKFLVPLYGGAMFLNIILNILFVPTFSYYAASLTTGLSEALVFVIMLWYFYKIKKD